MIMTATNWSSAGQSLVWRWSGFPTLASCWHVVAPTGPRSYRKVPQPELSAPMQATSECYSWSPRQPRKWRREHSLRRSRAFGLLVESEGAVYMVNNYSCSCDNPAQVGGLDGHPDSTSFHQASTIERLAPCGWEAEGNFDSGV